MVLQRIANPPGIYSPVEVRILYSPHFLDGQPLIFEGLFCVFFYFRKTANMANSGHFMTIWYTFWYTFLYTCFDIPRVYSVMGNWGYLLEIG